MSSSMGVGVEAFETFSQRWQQRSRAISGKLGCFLLISFSSSGEAAKSCDRHASQPACLWAGALRGPDYRHQSLLLSKLSWDVGCRMQDTRGSALICCPCSPAPGQFASAAA